MILFLKKNIKHFFNSRIVSLSGLLVLFFLFLPLSALAWVEKLISGIVNLPILAIAAFFLVYITLSQAIAFLMGAILDWVISPGFVSLSYTRPCPLPAGAEGPPCNPIIGMGLDITQDFVNLLLVVFLVYIALSIALRIGEHDAKKLFPRLIIIALLVNFAPVLVGLIVDASNIVMSYFLSPIQDGVRGVLNQVSPLGKSVWTQVKNWGGEVTTNMGLLAMVVSQIALNLSIAFVFFLFGIIFIVRYIVLWVLVILSPLAFVFWILPATKKFWDMWWSNLVQWSIIGIPMAFFLYLGLASFTAIQGSFQSQIETGELGSTATGFMNHAFPFFVIIAFLIIGFMVGLATSAMGASVIMKGGKAAGSVAGKKIASGTWRAVTETPKQVATRYRTARTAGSGRLQAAGQTAAAGYWAVRRGLGTARTAFTRGPGGAAVRGRITKASAAVTRGAWSALRDIAQAGALAGSPETAKFLGITEKKKKERPMCAKCGNFVPSGADHCPHCGTEMPRCLNCNRRAVPGATFCQSCGTRIEKP